jgi:hypothetical protein
LAFVVVVVGIVFCSVVISMSFGLEMKNEATPCIAIHHNVIDLSCLISWLFWWTYCSCQLKTPKSKVPFHIMPMNFHMALAQICFYSQNRILFPLAQYLVEYGTQLTHSHWSNLTTWCHAIVQLHSKVQCSSTPKLWLFL